MFIHTENLVKVFHLADQVELQALQGLDIEIGEGEMVGLVGASGSGKSTLLNIIGGLIQPTAGSISVNGRQLSALSTKELDRYRREEVGFVWQQSARNLIPWLNAIENVSYPMITAGTKRNIAQERATELLEMVGLGDRLTHKVEMLSGGEQSRVALAIALANGPSLLLADEPTGELDTATANMIYDLFRQLNRELNLTTLIVSHDPHIARHVDRVVLIRDGKLAGETVRTPKTSAESDEANEETEEVEFVDLIVVDGNGRLQIPPDIREELGFNQRIRLERLEDGIILRPVEVENRPAKVAPEKKADEQKQSRLGRLFGGNKS